MSIQQKQEQARIAAWFDATYGRKGLQYLRPVEAYYVFIELLQVQAGAKFLDVACGMGQMLLAAEEYDCELHGCDISRTALNGAKSRLEHASLVCCNGESLPYKNCQFDFVTCTGSLERMIDVNQVLAELIRVGKAGARCGCSRTAGA